MQISKLRSIVLPLVLACALFGCSTNDTSATEDMVQIDNLIEMIEFSSQPEDGVSFSSTSTRTWSIVKKNLEWATISQMNGGANHKSTITITADDNDDLARSGEMILYAGNTTNSVTIRQDAFPIVPRIVLTDVHEGDVFEFDYNEENPVSYHLYSNVDWNSTLTDLD